MTTLLKNKLLAPEFVVIWDDLDYSAGIRQAFDWACGEFKKQVHPDVRCSTVKLRGWMGDNDYLHLFGLTFSKGFTRLAKPEKLVSK